MKKIDMHHHLIEESGYIDALLKNMDKHEIELTGLMGLGTLFKGLFVKNQHDGSSADNKAVEKVVKKHSDRFFSYGFIRLGDDDDKKVDELYERGFSALKFHIPRKRYDAEEYFGIYEKAQKYNMACLFHTGVIAFPVPKPKEHISSFNMEPIHLEALAQSFPDLKIVIAHLGVQSYITALTLIRLFPNIYADLSGSTPGWRANISLEDWKRLLWFPCASKKIVFGSDVHYTEIKDSINIYESICSAAEWDKTQKEGVFLENIKTIIDL